MPNKNHGKDMNERDVADALHQLEQLPGIAKVWLNIRAGSYYPFEVWACVTMLIDDEEAMRVGRSFYTTSRYPNLCLPLWKALGSLQNDLEREAEGLPPLL